MKSFVDAIIPEEESLSGMPVPELLKIRFFNLKGKSGPKYNKIKERIEETLLAKADDFTLDDLAHLMEARSFKHKMTPRSKRVKGIGSCVVALYNKLIKRMIPFDHPYRYRYIISELLDGDNALDEEKAWLVGNSSYGSGFEHQKNSLIRILRECNQQDFDFISNQLVSGKASISHILLGFKNLDKKLRDEILTFKFINVNHLKEVDITPEFIDGIAPAKIIDVLYELSTSYKSQWARIDITLSTEKSKMKKALFPFISKNTGHVQMILNNFYGEKK